MTTLRELLDCCGPAVAAGTLTEGEVARAIREGRAMRIHVESCMGTQQSGLTTRLFDLPPDVVFAHPIPEHLRDVEQLEWDSRDDVLRWLDFIPRREPRRKRKRAAVPQPSAVSDQEREAIEKSLRPIADRQADADQENPGAVHGAPAIELVAVEGDALERRVHLVFDTMIWHAAQSGSDWFDHNVYVAQVVLAEGQVTSESIQRRRAINVSEHQEPTYDRAVARRAVVAEVVASRGQSRGDRERT